MAKVALYFLIGCAIATGATSLITYFIAVWNVRAEANALRGQYRVFFIPSALTPRGRRARIVSMLSCLLFCVSWFVFFAFVKDRFELSR